MSEYLNRYLNPNAYLKAYLPQITETFVNYYGESKRAIIEEKFKNIIITCTQTPKGTKHILSEILECYAQNLVKEFFLTLNIEYTLENIEKVFGNSSNPFEFVRTAPINKYIKCHEDNEMSFYLKQANLNSIKPFIILFSSQKNDIENLTYDKDSKEINEACLLFKKLYQKYQEFSSQYESITNYIDKCEKLKRKLENKYTLKLIKEYETLFQSNEIQSYMESNLLSPKIKAYLGYNINYTAQIEAFSQENEDILNDEKASLWKKHSILSDRVDFFKKMGLDLGDDYEAYKENPKAIKLIPNANLIENIKDSKEFLEMEMYNEYYTSLPEYQKVKNTLIQSNLLIKDDGYNASTFVNGGTYVTPNAKKQNERYIPFSFVNINMNNQTEHMDKNIIHELNHVYELTLQNVKEETVYHTCGWEELISDKNEEENITKKERPKRKYELFNEIINEIISQEIAQLLHKNNIYIFNSKENSKEIGGTDYENYKFLVKEFYQEFKEEILASRHGNIEIIYKACGRENFEQLNELFKIVHENWHGLKIIKLIEALDKGEINENTKKINEIIEKRDQILQNMLKHKNQLEQTKQTGKTK